MISIIFGIVILLCSLTIFILVGGAIKDGYNLTAFLLILFGIFFTFFSMGLIFVGLINYKNEII